LYVDLTEGARLFFIIYMYVKRMYAAVSQLCGFESRPFKSASG